MAFQKTVNLKDSKTTNFSLAGSGNIPARPRSVKSDKDESIDKVYRDGEDLYKINKIEKRSELGVYKKIAIVLFLLLVCFLVYSLAIKDNKNTTEKEEAVLKKSGWYSVKLVTGEVFFGRIVNESADPIVLESVYYNYDQIKDGEDQDSEIGNLRLVKRGKETHGPDGTMEIYREKILYKEPLSEASKVLQAILNYEK